MVQLMSRLIFFLLEAGIVDKNQAASTYSGEKNTAVGCGQTGGTFTPIRHPLPDLIAVGRGGDGQ